MDDQDTIWTVGHPITLSLSKPDIADTDGWVEHIERLPYAIFDVEDKAVEEALRLSFQLDGKPLPTVDRNGSSSYTMSSWIWKVEHWK